MCGGDSRSGESKMSTTVTDNGGGFELGCGISPSPVMINRGGNRMFLGGLTGKQERENGDGDLSSCSCSSIGKNSDDNDDGNDNGEEVESKYKCGGDDDNGSFDAIQALEEALPFRRGISMFYNGKSKSFTSLADASPSSSVKDIVKPENAYTRKRRNLLASTILWEDKNKCDSVDERISKRSCTNVSRTTTFAFAVAMNNSARSNIAEDSNPKNQLKQSQLNGSSPFIRNLSAVRSFSMADLQRCQ